MCEVELGGEDEDEDEGGRSTFWSRPEKRSNQDWTVARSVSSWGVSLSLLILGDGVWGDGVSKVGVSEGVG